MSSPDWAAIETDYRAGQLSNRALAERHGISESAIRKRAKKEGWEKTSKPAAKGAHSSVRSAHQDANLRTAIDDVIDDESLTPQQALFVVEYIKDKNATAAAERAGYSDSNYGRQLVAKPNVRDAINRQLRAQAERHLITADRILHELALIGFSNFQDLVDNVGTLNGVNHLPRDVTAAIKEVKVKVIAGKDQDIEETTYKLHDKRAALVDLAKHLQLFTPESEAPTTEPTPVKIEVNVVDARKHDQPEA